MNNNTYQDYLGRYVSLASSDPLATPWIIDEQGDRKLYKYGTDSENQAHEEAAGCTDIVGKLTYDTWTHRVTIAQQAEKVFDAASQEKIQQGVTLHEVLATIRHTGEAEDAVAEYAVLNNLDDDKRRYLTELIHRLMQQEECQRFFSPEHTCINERDMVIHGEIRRPDRIVLADGETWVIDFKTGKPNDSHKVQVRQYCDALKEMGYPQVKGYLMYIKKGQCRVVEA